MNHLRLALIVATVAGCSTPNPQPAPPIDPFWIAYNVELHNQPHAMQEPGSDPKLPQFCHLGTDCMELDSRPFVPCLVNGEPCQGEGGFMKAAPEVIVKDVPPGDIGILPDSSSKK